MGRTPCCDKNGLKKGPWTSDEDQKLMNYINKHGHGNWRTLPKNAGLQRCGKSCRLRWTNYLRPGIKRGRFSFEEEEMIIQLHSILGNKWSAIAARLPGRTDNEIKNYWNTHIRKRLLRMGIDPVTHTPRLDLSSILSTYNSAILSNSLSQYNLVNPQLLRLLLSSHHQSTTAFPQTQFLNHPTQHQPNPPFANPSPDQQYNLPDRVTPSSLDNYVPAPTNYCNYSDQPILDNLLFYSTDNNNFGTPSSTSSPTPLNSNNSTYVSADDDREIISYCTDLLKFDFPDVSNFNCNF